MHAICSTQIFKKDVDEHQQQAVPYCALKAHIITDDPHEQVEPLICSLDILGTTEKEKYFTFDIHPGIIIVIDIATEPSQHVTQVTLWGYSQHVQLLCLCTCT